MKEWMKNVRNVTPYVAGEQPADKNIIKLNTNENPYPPAPAVRELLSGFDTDILRKYPDPDIKDLCAELAAYHGLSSDRVFCGVGSDDVISVAFLTFFAGKKKVLFPDVTYAFYPVWAQLYGIPYEEIPLKEDFRIDAADYRRENGGIIIPNPNAPTSILEGIEFVEDILKHNPSSMVMIDEAYIDFGGKSVLPLLEKYDNLLVIRTFSKSRSMAGMRIGYCMGCKEAIAAMNSIKASINSYTLSQIAISAGVLSVKDDAYFKEQCGRIVKTRDEALKTLAGLGFTGPESAANFVFVKHESLPGDYIFEELKKRRIFVRHWNKPRIADYLRITIGSDEEMKRLYEALNDIIQSERK
ncbi:MAG: histidinol-phosphate transaminase [Lachnospiraceae bacterium]|jgi:histidinol-phosphate aminotransferase|nr:histidinol-phosphate transaminase [Lachnospiraceae bacterium]MBQ3967684.1 histidinol-phosphate transaminase [Lachnospiraceae bacterium]